MKRLLSLVMAVLLAMSLPMTAQAVIFADTSYGDVRIGDDGVNHYDDTNQEIFSSYEQNGREVEITHGEGSADGTVSVDMSSGSVTVTGDVTGGVIASGTADVTVTGDVSNDSGPGIFITGGSVTVNEGDVTGGVAEENSGYDGVYMEGGSVTVTDGNVSGGDSASGQGGGGVLALGGSITVGGDVIGGDSSGESDWGGRGVELQNDAAAVVDGNIAGGQGQYGGAGAIVYDGAKLEAGSITGGDGTDIWGGAGLEGFGTVTVHGDVTGGDAMGDNGLGGNAIQTSGGDTTVAGNAVGGSAANGQGGSGISVLPGDSGSVYLEKDALGGIGADGTQAPGIVVYPGVEGDSYPQVSVNNTNEVKALEGMPGITEELTQEDMQAFITLRNGSLFSEGGSAPGEAMPSGSYIQRVLFKIENGAGLKPVWDETREGSTLTITVEKEPVVFTIWLEGLQELQKQGVQTLVIKTESCETTLVIADLIARNGTEYILTQEGGTASLSVDGTIVEI